MMPKGVEHQNSSTMSSCAKSVSLPMMPKGVEHPKLFFRQSNLHLVSLPMMPKGVEHRLRARLQTSHAPGESSDDAERR